MHVAKSNLSGKVLPTIIGDIMLLSVSNIFVMIKNRAVFYFLWEIYVIVFT